MGTDYRRVATPALWKAMARRLLLTPAINRPVVMALAPLQAAEWKRRIPVVGAATLRLGNDRSVVLQKAERCQVAKEVYWGQGHLHGAADRLALQLAITLSADADTFLDIGAYTGLFALAVARENPRIQCDAYEIVPDNYVLMWENTIRNNLVARVHPRLVGLGAAKGTLKVPGSFGSGALASSVALDSVAADGVDIPIAALDELYAGYASKMVMKIDVEGFEWEVLRGGRQLIARVKPDMVCEVLRRAPNVPEMEAFLRQVGYNIFHISDAGLRPADRIVPVKLERDWLFTTRSASELQARGFPLTAAPS
ncbi:FkbM family methyltransferase [Ramlibacter alkalitolerans]|uniref:FkbM family methyltransferase n=1 Tax=Ramlibacter alkalitolerans TaxID=2039631 RepID=A0ABS1JNF0_9BURK|nr:FkbM family methyltransferase [Ramlibacter alkalitolerans]